MAQAPFGALDSVLWFAEILVSFYLVFRAISQRKFLSYFALNFYVLASLVLSAARYAVLYQFGLASMEYLYFHNYSASVMTILLYFVILMFFTRLFDEMEASRTMRIGAILLLGGTALFSFLIVQDHRDHLTSRFVVELSRNHYFVGLLLTCLLWGSVLKLRETRLRDVQLVLSLGVYFGGFTVLYALHWLIPSVQTWKMLPPSPGLWLPLAWAYTFTRIEEGSRLAPARVAVAHS